MGSSTGWREAFDLGVDSVRQGDCPGALAHLDRAVALAPEGAERAEAHQLRATLRCMAGELEGAIEDHDASIRQAPDLPELWFDRGHTYLATGDLERAIADFDQALALDPRRVDALLARGSAYAMQGALVAAIADCDQALEIDPTSASAHYNRGNYHIGLDQIEEAAEDYRTALRLDPWDPDVCNNLAQTLEQLDRIEEAFDVYEQALEIDPEHDEALYNRAWLLHRIGESEDALGAYDELLEFFPHHAPAHLRRGRLLADLGERERAVADFERAASLAPDLLPRLDESAACAAEGALAALLVVGNGDYPEHGDLDAVIDLVHWRFPGVRFSDATMVARFQFEEWDGAPPYDAIRDGLREELGLPAAPEGARVHGASLELPSGLPGALLLWVAAEE